MFVAGRIRPFLSTSNQALRELSSAGFLAGVATFVLYRLRHPRGRKIRVAGRQGKKIEVAESRSFLVDIHLLKR